MLGRLFGFRGRIGRLDYLLTSLGVIGCIGIVLPRLPLLAWDAFTGGDFTAIGQAVPPMYLIPAAAFAAVSWAALATRRLHDIGLSGWHVLWIALIPITATLLPGLLRLPGVMLPWLWLCAARGEKGENGYGAPPGLLGERVGSGP